MSAAARFKPEEYPYWLRPAIERTAAMSASNPATASTTASRNEPGPTSRAITAETMPGAGSIPASRIVVMIRRALSATAIWSTICRVSRSLSFIRKSLSESRFRNNRGKL